MRSVSRPAPESRERNQSFLFDPAEIDTLLLTHAHIDHSGNIPNLVNRGFPGPIYATAAAVDLSEVLLRDSAHIHEQDAAYLSKENKKEGLPPVEALYTTADVEAALPLFRGVEYSEAVPIAKGISATFQDAGHILGSAGILFEIEENGKTRRLGITGDIGRTKQTHLARSQPAARARYYAHGVYLWVAVASAQRRCHRRTGKSHPQGASTRRSHSDPFFRSRKDANACLYAA
jgi:Cft2 family RNA processing exonuclease